MRHNVRFCCDAMTRGVHLGAVRFVAKFREWGIPIPDGGTSFLELMHCPWCGTVLPASLRDVWFDKAEAMHIDPPYEDMPTEYQSDAWWNR